MTRPRKLLALMVVTAVVAVTIPVLMPSRDAGVIIKFAGFSTNGATLMRLENRSGRRLAVGRLFTFEPGQKRAVYMSRPTPRSMTTGLAVSWQTVRDREEALFEISPAPQTPWHAQVEYLDVGGLGIKVRHLLAQARLLQPKPLALRNATSEMITNTPPAP
jgi:hypothetical protein